MEKKPRSGSVTKVREALTEEFLTNYEIARATDLTVQQVSMSLSYLHKVKFCEREQIDRQANHGRKKVYAYKLANATQAA